MDGEGGCASQATELTAWLAHGAHSVARAGVAPSGKEAERRAARTSARLRAPDRGHVHGAGSGPGRPRRQPAGQGAHRAASGADQAIPLSDHGWVPYRRCAGACRGRNHLGASWLLADTQSCCQTVQQEGFCLSCKSWQALTKSATPLQAGFTSAASHWLLPAGPISKSAGRFQALTAGSKAAWILPMLTVSDRTKTTSETRWAA